MGSMEQSIQDQFVFKRATAKLEEHSDAIFAAVTGVLNGHAQNAKLCLDMVEMAYRVASYLHSFIGLQARALGVDQDALAKVAAMVEEHTIKRFEEVYKGLKVMPDGKIEPVAVVVPDVVPPPNLKS